MDKEVKKIIFTFENCEAMEFNRNCIGYFYVGGIKTCINRIAINSIRKVQKANEIVIELFSEGNGEYDDKEIKTKFNRIKKYNDITSVDIEYEDGSTEEYWVNYKDDPKYSDIPYGVPNLYQKTLISTQGNLYLVIKKGKKIYDYFDKEDINDSRFIQYLKGMYESVNFSANEKYDEAMEGENEEDMGECK